MNVIKEHRLFYRLQMNAHLAYRALERFIEEEQTKEDAAKLAERVKKRLEQIEKAARKIREDLEK